MKILTGKLRGQKIKLDPTPKLRPTSDKVRQAIFNMFQGEIEGKEVLDLYSGTGALGIEALSQGAARVEFVEENWMQCQKIKTTLRDLNLSDRAVIKKSDAVKEVARLSGQKQNFQFVFLDPPYGKNLAYQTLQAIARSEIVKLDSWVVCEAGKAEQIPETIGRLERVKNKYYGDTQILIYKTNPR